MPCQLAAAAVTGYVPALKRIRARMPDEPRINPYSPPSGSFQRDESLQDNQSAIPDELAIDLQHVMSAVNYAIAERQENDNDEVHINASEICHMVLALACRMTAYDPSGNEAIEYLREMNLHTSNDVGRAVEELDRLGLTRADDDDHPSDFDGLFDLGIPTDEWALSFDFASELS
jgi:uncharacterized repeat protein (TIGR04138 family)